VHPITEWIRYCEENGVEFPMTVIATGMIISGNLSPFARYERWCNEIDHRTRLSGDRLELPNIKLPLLTAEEQAGFREQWQARLEAARAEHGYPPTTKCRPASSTTSL
jgi:hypothetical protein